MYLVSIYQKDEFSVFIYNPDSSDFCRTFTSSFILSVNLYLVLTSTSPTYAHTILNPSNSSDIFSVIYPICCTLPLEVLVIVLPPGKDDITEMFCYGG